MVSRAVLEIFAEASTLGREVLPSRHLLSRERMNDAAEKFLGASEEDRIHIREKARVERIERARAAVPLARVRGVLTMKEANEIRSQLRVVSMSEISRRYGVSRTSVYRISKGITWRVNQQRRTKIVISERAKILACPESAKSIARRYGVHPSTIYAIKRAK